VEHPLREPHHLVAIAALLGGDARDLLRQPGQRHLAVGPFGPLDRLAHQVVAIEQRLPEPLRRRRRHAIAGDLDARRHHPRVVDAPEERVILDAPVRVGGAKRLVQRARLLDLRMDRRRTDGRRAALRRHGRHRIVEPRQPPAITRQQRAHELRHARDALADDRFPDRLRRGAAGNADAIVFDGEAARRQPERSGSGARDPPQQAAIALEQRPRRRVGGQRPGAHQQHRAIGDQRREQIARRAGADQVAPVIGRERDRDADWPRRRICSRRARRAERADETAHAGGPLGGAAALSEQAARQQRDRRAALLRLQAEHVKRRRAAGYGQIKKSWDGLGIVGGG
jgi:hypothetical protein